MYLMKHCLYLLLSIVLLFGGLSAQTKSGTKPVTKKQESAFNYGCLPSDITLETIVETKQTRSATGAMTLSETVSQRLKKMKARCKAGALIDRNGKQIRFYKLQSCWGNPPADYLEILDAEKDKLRLLKKKFTVIEIGCDSTGIAPV
jgi:hypothetical protein